MRKKLFVLSFLLVASCSYFRENHRTIVYNSNKGNRMVLTVFEEIEVFGKEKSLKIYVGEYGFKGRQCEEPELKNLGDELWDERVKRNYVSEVKSGTVFILRNQGEVNPDYCRYNFLRNENGEWIDN